MTLPQFLRTFRRLAKPGEWTLDGDSIRHKRTGCCPVSFVARKLKHRRYNPTAIAVPGAALGIRSDARGRIANAADFPKGHSIVKGWRHSFVRNRLLEITNLKGE